MDHALVVGAALIVEAEPCAVWSLGAAVEPGRRLGTEPRLALRSCDPGRRKKCRKQRHDKEDQQNHRGHHELRIPHELAPSVSPQ